MSSASGNFSTNEIKLLSLFETVIKCDVYWRGE